LAKGRRQEVKTQWIDGIPEKENIGATLIIKTFKEKRPHVAKIISISDDGDITARPAGESYDVVFEKGDIKKYHVLSFQTQEFISKCRKS